MGLGFDEESLQKRGCNRKKRDVHILPFSDSQKTNIQKGSRKLDET